MISLNVESKSSSREKVPFPVEVAVDNVSLKSIEKNEKFQGLTFVFQRADSDTISWLNGNILVPKKEWITSEKQVKDKVLSIEEQWLGQVNSWLGYVRHILKAAGIENEVLNQIQGETIDDVIDSIVKTINPLLNPSNLFYLKTVKNKGGYTSLPTYRGTGVAQSMDLGYPTNFVYTDYEQQLIDENYEGVDDTEVSNQNSGLDF